MELGFQELLLIGIVLVLFFGPKKLPELGSGIGKAIREFKNTLHDTTSDIKEGLEANAGPSTTASPEQPTNTEAPAEKAPAEQIAQK